LQPPLADALANHGLKSEFTCACVKQAAVVLFTGQVNDTTDAAVTVNVAEQVSVNGSHVLVYVNVTVVEPPQADGAPVLSLVMTTLQPPVDDAVANQSAN
jgi:type IV pilus biogenesis protein CpaD/CtpE